MNLQKRRRTNNLTIFLAIILIAFFVPAVEFQLIKYLAIIMTVVFSLHLIMSTKKEGFAAALCVFLGCATIIMGMLISYEIGIEKPFTKVQFFFKTISEQGHFLYISKEFLHTYSLFTGASCIALGMIFAYKPSLIQVKNFVPYEYPYPIWNSKKQPMTKFSKNLRIAKELLTYKERMLLCRFKYLLVSIDDKLYLVSPNEMVPENSIIIRTKSGNTLCGISRF